MASHDKHDDDDVKIFQKKDFDKGKTPEKKEGARWKNSNVWSSLEFALSGIVTAFQRERNMRKHALTSLIVVVFGLIFKISEIEWLFLLLSVFLVITAELFNSAIENVVDLASDYNFHMRAKRAKDMAAGAVLFISGFALIVGLIIFLPKIWSLIFG
ncbi:diacylglycerol kinase family protein [Lactococcus termiticola]|uniref:Diacylglycerol kinase n=1 Tax=Lactococcus termiticola TaxID=2169526 RepID=A0A2R5HIY7_9LACT|nr:diacylglycerol kinase family protein [Lactococcus termiticola]GBG96398.1 diacylglycerol kinase [Lactococcus termiticola]